MEFSIYNQSFTLTPNWFEEVGDVKQSIQDFYIFMNTMKTYRKTKKYVLCILNTFDICIGDYTTGTLLFTIKSTAPPLVKNYLYSLMQDLHSNKEKTTLISQCLKMKNQDEFKQLFVNDPTTDQSLFKLFCPRELLSYYENKSSYPVKRLSSEVMSLSDKGSLTLDIFQLPSFLRREVLKLVPLEEFNYYPAIKLALASIWDLYYYDRPSGVHVFTSINNRSLTVRPIADNKEIPDLFDTEIGVAIHKDYNVTETEDQLCLTSDHHILGFSGAYSPDWVSDIKRYAKSLKEVPSLSAEGVRQ